MRAVCTGDSGFVAQRLAALLPEQGWQLGTDEAAAPDCVVHFATARSGAIGPDDLSQELQTLERALETALQHRARFMLVTSEIVVGTSRPGALDEESPSILEADSDIIDDAISSLFAEQLAFAYRDAHGLQTTVLRLHGAYGPGQPLTAEEGGIGDWIVAAVRKQPMTPAARHAICCLSHVDDLARGIVQTLQSDAVAGEIISLADPRSVRAGEVAQLIWRLAGNSGPSLFAGDARTGRKSFRAPVEVAKARRLVGFAPTVDLEQGLRDTIQWHARRLTRT
jgi:nucleoside-diphosphate-sugar epimerase